MYRGTAHVVLGSGLTVAGAVFCLSFTRLPYFQSLGMSRRRLGILVALAASLTLGPAVITMGSLFGLFDPKREMQTRGWRRIGTAIVRWPGPILVVATAVALIGLLALPGYKTSYDTRPYMPATAPANIGYAAAERHFSRARLKPELLMIEADHDMRNPADMINPGTRWQKAVVHLPGIAQVQSMTRPLGTPSTTARSRFRSARQSVGQVENLNTRMDRADDLMKQADELKKTIGILKRQYALQQHLAAATHAETQGFHDTLAIIIRAARQDREFRRLLPADSQLLLLGKALLRHPGLFCAQNTFESIDSIDQLAEKFDNLSRALDKLDAVQPQLVGLIPPQIANQESNQELTLSNYATNSGINAQTVGHATTMPTALGQAFDAAKNDDSFYLPPEVFVNPELKRGLKLFLSPDGKAARMIITHEGDPADPRRVSRISTRSATRRKRR